MKGLRCHYCGILLTDAWKTRDHKIPKSKGGKGEKNMVWACLPCNQEKGSKNYYIFLQEKGLLGGKKSNESIR